MRFKLSYLLTLISQSPEPLEEGCMLFSYRIDCVWCMSVSIEPMYHVSLSEWSVFVCVIQGRHLLFGRSGSVPASLHACCTPLWLLRERGGRCRLRPCR